MIPASIQLPGVAVARGAQSARRGKVILGVECVQSVILGLIQKVLIAKTSSIIVKLDNEPVK